MAVVARRAVEGGTVTGGSTGQPSGSFHPDGTAGGECPVSEKLYGLQVLAGLEPNGLAGWDGNLFPGPGVTADSGLARFDIEDAESPKLNSIVALKRALHRIEHGVNGSLGLAPGNSGPLHDMIDDV